MKRFPLWHLAIVAVLSILTYANSASGAYLWDDEVQIVKNSNLRSLSTIPSAFTQPFWGFATPEAVNQSNFYRPTQTVLYTLAYAWGGLDPFTGHLMSITLHTLAGILVYLICVQLGLLPGVSLLAAALFATHPIHTEAVAWIAATPDLACGVFYFASFLAFLRSDYGEQRKWHIISALLLLPALLSKEMAITLPVVIFLYSFRRLTFAQQAKLLTPYAVATAIYLAMRINALGFVATQHTNLTLSALDWFTLGVHVSGRYIWFALIPHPLLAYHQIPLRLDDRLIPFVIALAAVLGLSFLAWKKRAFWFLAFAVMLVPVFYFNGISTAFMADRYLYIPSLAAVILVATSLAAMPTRYALWIGWAVVGIFAVRSMDRNQDWKDGETIFAQTLESEPNIARIQLDLAKILLNRGDDNGARLRMETALASMDSGKYSQLPDDYYRAHIGLGAILARSRNYPQAREHLEAAKQADSKGEWPYLYLGGIAMEADNDMPKAVELLQTAVRLGPINELARDYLGIAYFNLGRVQEAKTEFEEALKINPTHTDARAHLEMANKALAPAQ
jgi:tetratricopeptide (TPR) repeat protein